MKSNLVFIFLFIAFGAFAQNEFYFPFEIIKLKKEGVENEYSARIQHDVHIEIRKGAEGRLYSIYNDKDRTRKQFAGTVEITEVAEGEAIALIRISGTRTDWVDSGVSMIEIPADLRNAPKYKNVLYDVLRRNIRMTDVYGEKDMFTFSDLASNYSSLAETKLMKAMVKESAFVAEAMAEQMDSPPVTKGRMKGTDLFSAMKNVNRQDIRDFLLYVSIAPRKYAGKTWKFSEVFATWIDAGCPTTERHLVETLEWGIAEEAYINKLLQHQTESRLDNVSKILRDSMSACLAMDDLDNAYSWKGALESLYPYLEKENQAWHHFSLGEYWEANANNEAAVEEYKEAISRFTETENEAGLLGAYNNIGNALRDAGGKRNLKSAISYFDKALEKMIPLSRKNPSISSITAKVVLNKGRTLRKMGDTDKAIALLQEELTHLEKTDEAGWLKKSEIYFEIAEIFEEKGDAKKQADFETKAVSAYREYELMKNKKKRL